MPMLIDSPESRRRRLRRTVYFVAQRRDGAAELSPFEPSRFELPKALTDWLHQHMPAVDVGPIGPSEHSGWIEGGPRGFYLDMSAEQAERFAAHWEHPSQADAEGRTPDQLNGLICYELPYPIWRQRLDACVVHAAKREQDIEPGDHFVFWDTASEGLLWAEMASGKSTAPSLDPRCSVDDLWIRPQELLPWLADVEEPIVSVEVFRRGGSVDCDVTLSWGATLERRDEFLGASRLGQGAHTAWQRRVCEHFGWPVEAVRFGSPW